MESTDIAQMVVTAILFAGGYVKIRAELRAKQPETEATAAGKLIEASGSIVDDLRTELSRAKQEQETARLAIVGLKAELEQFRIEREAIEHRLEKCEQEQAIRDALSARVGKLEAALHAAGIDPNTINGD